MLRAYTAHSTYYVLSDQQPSSSYMAKCKAAVHMLRRHHRLLLLPFLGSHQKSTKYDSNLSSERLLATAYVPRTSTLVFVAPRSCSSLSFLSSNFFHFIQAKWTINETDTILGTKLHWSHLMTHHFLKLNQVHTIQTNFKSTNSNFRTSNIARVPSTCTIEAG